jgi:hypothetical protein
MNQLHGVNFHIEIVQIEPVHQVAVDLQVFFQLCLKRVPPTKYQVAQQKNMFLAVESVVPLE